MGTIGQDADQQIPKIKLPGFGPLNSTGTANRFHPFCWLEGLIQVHPCWDTKTANSYQLPPIFSSINLVNPLTVDGGSTIALDPLGTSWFGIRTSAFEVCSEFSLVKCKFRMPNSKLRFEIFTSEFEVC